MISTQIPHRFSVHYQPIFRQQNILLSLENILHVMYMLRLQKHLNNYWPTAEHLMGCIILYWCPRFPFLPLNLSNYQTNWGDQTSTFLTNIITKWFVINQYLFFSRQTTPQLDAQSNFQNNVHKGLNKTKYLFELTLYLTWIFWLSLIQISLNKHHIKHTQTFAHALLIQHYCLLISEIILEIIISTSIIN